MSPFIAALYMASAASLSVGALAGVAWWRRRDLAHYGFFALVAVFAGLMSLMEPGIYQATTVSALAGSLWWNVTFAIFFLGSFAWFLVSYTGVASRGLAWLITAILGVDLVIQVFSPFSLLYSEITSIETARLPWGETVAVAVGPPTALRPLVEAPGLLLGVLFGFAVVRMWKTGVRRRALLLSAAFVPYFVLFSLWGPMVDLGIVTAPYLASFGFLFVILVVGGELARDVADASRLTAEVALRERQWRALAHRVHLAIVRVDEAGVVVDANPFFCTLMLEDQEALMGRRFVDLVPGEARPKAERRFARVLEGGAARPVQRTVVDRDGVRHTLLWSAVAVQDDRGRPVGAITVGSDITERIDAEAARDGVMEELRALKEQLEEENLYLRQEVTTAHGFDEIIGNSAELQYVLHRVQQVASTDATVLIEGETGVGKELVARAVHQRSQRSDAPFVKVNCAALPETLIESELFGHERGAFTGATGLRKGRFELADDGTLFLDEIAELPLALQVKLLRVLQEGEFERVGSSETRQVDVRIVAATNRDLQDEVSAGRFRQDLFYRLNVYLVTVPPLRERAEDIPALVSSFVQRVSARTGRAVEEVSARAMQELMAYSWPGNIRELQNVVERAVILTDGPVLRLPPGSLGPRSSEDGLASAEGADTGNGTPRLVTIADLEREHIRAVLEWTGGRVGGPDGAAEILGLHPNTLRSRMKKLGVLVVKA